MCDFSVFGPEGPVSYFASWVVRDHRLGLFNITARHPGRDDDAARHVGNPSTHHEQGQHPRLDALERIDYGTRRAMGCRFAANPNDDGVRWTRAPVEFVASVVTKGRLAPVAVALDGAYRPDDCGG